MTALCPNNELMPSTNAVEIVPIAESLVELWLAPRRHWLRKKESRIAYVRDARKKIATAVSKPFHMLVAGSLADIDDGAPLSVVLQPWYAVIGLLRERSAQRDKARGKTWCERYHALQQREEDAEAKLDKAQLKLGANTADLVALNAKRVAIREYRVVLDEMEALIDERFATPLPS